ncbi:MAG: hypothetical protein D6702_02900 [Planctomycetota bacterium]|nr:MAG: hypothetical protein D6702_02900 [Planctomycetota bacterium]
MNAAKERFGPDDLPDLFADARTVTVARGRRILRFDLAGGDPLDEAFHKAVLGPSGNLRAPTVRCGRNWLVGFHPEAWEERFGPA